MILHRRLKLLWKQQKEKVKSTFSRLPVRQENDTKKIAGIYLITGMLLFIFCIKTKRETYAIEKFWNHAYSILEDEWRETAKEYSEYNNNK